MSEGDINIYQQVQLRFSAWDGISNCRTDSSIGQSILILALCDDRKNREVEACRLEKRNNAVDFRIPVFLAQWSLKILTVQPNQSTNQIRFGTLLA